MVKLLLKSVSTTLTLVKPLKIHFTLKHLRNLNAKRIIKKIGFQQKIFFVYSHPNMKNIDLKRIEIRVKLRFSIKKTLSC